MSERMASLGLPRPSRTVKAVLGVLVAVSVAFAIIWNWLPGGEAGVRIFSLLTCNPADVVAGQIWRPFTAMLLTSPEHVEHVLFSALGIYFAAPDLERRWGPARLIRFMVIAGAVGFLLATAVDRLPLSHAVFHGRNLFGPTAAITALWVAWSRENEKLQFRFLFVLPMTGKQLLYLTVGMCVLYVVYFQRTSEGPMAPFGGILTGLALAGSPSPARRWFLRLKLLVLRQRKHHLRAEDLLDDEPKSKRRRPGAPALRVVSGGLEDELKKRKPPKDPRYLN
jgi:membrane associated rhomboid family serine protease